MITIYYKIITIYTFAILIVYIYTVIVTIYNISLFFFSLLPLLLLDSLSLPQHPQQPSKRKRRRREPPNHHHHISILDNPNTKLTQKQWKIKPKST